MCFDCRIIKLDESLERVIKQSTPLSQDQGKNISKPLGLLITQDNCILWETALILIAQQMFSFVLICVNKSWHQSDFTNAKVHRPAFTRLFCIPPTDILWPGKEKKKV